MASTDHAAEEKGDPKGSASQASELSAEGVARAAFILTMIGVVLYVGAVLLFGQ